MGREKVHHRWENCDHGWKPPPDKAVLSELLDNRTLLQVRYASEFTIKVSYPPLDERAQKYGDKDDPEVGKEVKSAMTAMAYGGGENIGAMYGPDVWFCMLSIR